MLIIFATTTENAVSNISMEKESSENINEQQDAEEEIVAEKEVITSSMKEEIIGLYKNGKRTAEIFEQTSYSEDIISQVLQEFINASLIKSGMYKVGSEIDAGLYLINSSCYWEITKDSSGEFDSIIGNDNCENYGYVELRDGDYFSFNNGVIVLEKYASLTNIDSGNLISGTYIVGKDIPAGEYKVEGSYWERRSGARSSMEEIIANDAFDGSTYVTIRNGEFFKFTGNARKVD